MFYDRLNQLLAKMEFDQKLEAAAEPYYETTGRKGLPPGVYFRMIFIGFFEDISSQRGIAWRCDDSNSMKSIVRRDTGDDWREYLRKLYEAETGASDPDDDELRRFDRHRKNKRVRNQEWVSETDPDARIGKMKDGRTHLKYKAENAVDLDTEILVSAEVYHGDYGDTVTIEDTVNMAQAHLNEAETGCQIEEVVADKGYHSEDSLDRLQNESLQRTYIPEAKRKTVEPDFLTSIPIIPFSLCGWRFQS